MSRRTRSVAVAVNAATVGRVGSPAMNSPMPRYEERKSCPHWETQCASSTATSEIGARTAKLRNRSVSKRSGATYSSLIWPESGLREDEILLVRRLSGVDERGRKAHVVQGVDLVAHEGDQRRDDDGDARQDRCGNLVADGFAGAGGHDAKHVTSGEDGRNDAGLSRTERIVAEIAVAAPPMRGGLRNRRNQQLASWFPSVAMPCVDRGERNSRRGSCPCRPFHVSIGNREFRSGGTPAPGRRSNRPRPPGRRTGGSGWRALRAWCRPRRRGSWRPDARSGIPRRPRIRPG